MKKTIAVLPGDGIGREVVEQALRVLEAVGSKFGHSFETREALVGGAAWDAHGTHFPAESKKVCDESDAIFFGSVGGPVAELHLEKWKGCEANSLLAIRKAFSLNANFRPVKVFPELVAICPLKEEIISRGIDLLIVRELIGDIYFGEHKRFVKNGLRVATDLAEYDEEQIASVAHTAFKAARTRKKKLTSVDKANVLDTSKLWREVVNEVHKDYSDVELEHMLVDNCAMQLITKPYAFDVVLTSNMFGDILSDAAAVLPGSLGLLASASLNKDGFGFYEPPGGSAQDIAGKGIANPIAQIRTVAMMLQYSFGLLEEATCIENAVSKTLASGYRTVDIALKGEKSIGTKEMADEILSFL